MHTRGASTARGTDAATGSMRRWAALHGELPSKRCGMDLLITFMLRPGAVVCTQWCDT